MSRKLLPVYFIDMQLRFYLADNWDYETLASCVDEGELTVVGPALSDNGAYLRLSVAKTPASFSLERLSGFVGEVKDHKGRAMDPRERAVVLKYYSQHGIFLHGDYAGYKRKFDRRPRPWENPKKKEDDHGNT